MATKRHAKKRHRQSENRRLRNRAVKSETRTAVKRAQAAPAAESGEAHRRAQRAIDVAARKGVLKKRAAARKKSRLAKRLNKDAAAA